MKTDQPYNPIRQREYNTRAYAKRLGITVEQLEARRQSAREWKERNKERRTKQGYAKINPTEKLKTGPKSGDKVKRNIWWEKLKKKHAGKSRLKKSIKPPEFLTHSDQERFALRVEG